MQPSYRITEKMLNQVQRISELTTQLAIERRELHLHKESRIRSIQSSLAIENNSLSIEQVTAVIEGKRVLGPPKDIHEVENAYEAYERAFQLDPYSVDDFLTAHRLLTKDLVTHAGQFRTGDVGVYDSAGQVIHVGARPQFVAALVQELFDWAKASDISDYVKSCIVHFELEIIHPFEDGNGRMGRLWQSVILSHCNPIFEWLPIESVIYHYQQGYYDALAFSNQSNDATVFIEFMLDAILETLKNYQDTQLQSQTVRLNPKEEAVWEKINAYLLEHTSITNSIAQELLGLSESSTRRYLALFSKNGFLIVEGTTRDRRYRLG
ncbi:Fic family protein [Streptococcus pantholopis]|uniref:Cell filamentation protein Fic n=1 Tax=Streptococcus pantholopis TaxID=1811193 RepID=A0A172Q9Q9_9STRE|nr:Fic family protein [Streptococcus pantholopis]AND80196.1 cell filamentation protein Fic [Streptococcus pantholopis]